MKTYLLLAAAICCLSGCQTRNVPAAGMPVTNNLPRFNETDFTPKIKDPAFLKLVTGYKLIAPDKLENIDSIFYSFPLDRDIENKKINDQQMVKYLFPEAEKYRTCSVFNGVKFSVDDCLFLLSYINRSLDTTEWSDTLFLHLNVYNSAKGSVTGFDIAANNAGETEPTYTMQSKFYFDSLGLKIVTGSVGITDTNIYLHHTGSPAMDGVHSSLTYRINFKHCLPVISDRSSINTKLKTVLANDYTFETLTAIK